MNPISRLSDKEEEKNPSSFANYLPGALHSSDKEMGNTDKNLGEMPSEEFEFPEEGMPIIYASNLREAYAKIHYYQTSSSVSPEIRKKFIEKFSDNSKDGKVMFELKGTTNHSDGIKEYLVNKEDHDSDEEEVVDRNSKTLQKESLDEPKYSLMKKGDDAFLEDAEELLDTYSHQFGNQWLESAFSCLPELGDAYELLSALTGKAPLGGTNIDKTDRAIAIVGIVPLKLASGNVLKIRKNHTTYFIPETLYLEACTNPDAVLKKYREKAIAHLKKLWCTMESFLKELPNESMSGFYGEPTYHKIKKTSRRNRF